MRYKHNITVLVARICRKYVWKLKVLTDLAVVQFDCDVSGGSSQEEGEEWEEGPHHPSQARAGRPVWCRLSSAVCPRRHTLVRSDEVW